MGALKQLQDTEPRCSTHSEHSDESSLQQPHQYVTPVMFVVRHASVSYIQRKRHQEELDGRSNQSRPLPLHSGLDVELHTQPHILKWHLNLNLFICQFCVLFA